jgi:hypothetical protein
MGANINDTLLHHLSTGPGAACFLRKTCPELLECVDRMFRSRSDVRRLVAAQDVARAVLKKNDADDLLRLRDIVATQELRRLIKYPDQKDHTAHTVYLYLLGVWLFDHLQDVRKNFVKKHKISNVALSVKSGCDSPGVEVDSVDEKFLFHWMYASLLHDVGYAFYDLSPDTDRDRKKINNLFSRKSLLRLFGSISTEAQDAIKDAHDEWEQTYHSATVPMNLKPHEVLDHLSNAPWVSALVPGAKGKDLFDLLELSQQPLLRNYAYEVALSGYPPNYSGHVDHAVASGLFLLRYSGFWYWLVDHVRRNNQAHYDALTRCFNNDLSILEKGIIPACRAVASHNVQRHVSAASDIIPLLTLKDEPLLFLSVLADELQFWDRPPSGDKNLVEYRKSAKSAFDGSELNLRCDGPRSMMKAAFIVRSRSSSRNRSKLDALCGKLNDRLPGWGELVELRVEKR